MIFKHTKVSGLDYQLPAVTTDMGRWYQTPEGKRYPSASSVAGILSRDAIEKWRKRVGAEAADKKTKKGADRGTYIHLLCEKYLLNTMTMQERLGMMPTMKELFLQIKKFFDEHISEIYCIEQALYSDRLRIAGRCDAIVVWDGEPVILDIKTAGYIKPEAWILNYFVQTSAYAEMFEERTGIPVHKVVLATAIEGELHGTITMKKKDAYLPVLDECIATYYMEQDTK
jgi:genome maintenance exonuclease 1